MVVIFHFLQSDMVFGSVNPFSRINAISGEKSNLISTPFLLTYIDVRTVKSFRLLNPDWGIQISRVPAVRKVSHGLLV